MKRVHCAVIALALLIALARPSTVAAAPAANDQQGPFSLRQTLQLAAKRNLGLLQQALEKKRKALAYEVAIDGFVPKLTLDAGYGNATPFDTALPRDQRLRYGASVSWTAPIGTQISAAANVDQRLRGRTPESQAINTINHTSAAGLAVRQPLLKGAGRSGAANALDEAKLDGQIQREVFREQLNTLLLQVEIAYWALAYAQREVMAKESATKQAQRQVEDIKENIRRGITADIEVYLVQENLVFFQQELVQAKQGRELAQRALAQLLQLPPATPIIASDALDKQQATAPSTQRATRGAMEHNPSLAAEQLRLARQRITLRFEKKQALPSLDLVGSLTLNGLDSDYATHIEEIYTAKRPELSVGLTLSLPLSFRAYRARVTQAQLAVQKQLLSLKEQEVRVRHQTERLLREIDYRRRQLELAKRREALSRLKLEAEQKKYKSGISTLDSIVRFQRELDQAALGVWRTQRDLMGSRSALLALSGTLHAAFGIRIDD